MRDRFYPIPYPRRPIRRGIIHLIGRLLLPIPFPFKFELSGKEKLPSSGPLIVIGNHTAAMETVFINIYIPWQLEMLRAGDVPAERFMEWTSDLFGLIPVNRGAYNRAALRKALNVLAQGVWSGSFPKAGFGKRGRDKPKRACHERRAP